MNQSLNNLLTDAGGLKVGNASDDQVKSGVTVVVCEEPCVASAHIMGGAPGTRETDLLQPEQTVEAIDAIVLAGGSAFGLEAASGVMARLVAAGRGFSVGSALVPLVPTAILFDLLNGGDKERVATTLYRDLAGEAFDQATDTFSLGSVGAGTGATTANLKGGLGSASARLDDGEIVAALTAVNALGQATIADTEHFWAAPFEQNGEFGGRGYPSPLPAGAVALRHKMQPAEPANTTLAVVATNVSLTKAETKRVAIMAHDGFARALWPVHTPFDGDIVFAIATARLERKSEPDLVALGSAAAACVARAIARGVYEASPAERDVHPTWRQRFGGGVV